MFSAFILSLIAFLRNGRVFPFVNSVVILFALIGLSQLENESNKVLNKSNQKNLVSTDSVSRQNITFIQPFTSLAEFNWKFGKETKKKESEVKIISMPSIYLSHLIRK